MQSSAIEYENGPSSFSTLHILPDYIRELMNENEIESYYNTENERGNKKESNLNGLDRTNRNNINDKTMNEPNDSDQDGDIYIPQSYPLLNRSKANATSTNTKKLDYEIMAFVGLKDIIKVPEPRLSKLYGRNYPSLVAAINNGKTNYLGVINEAEFRILYHMFSRVNGRNSWREIIRDLGYTHFWDEHISEILYFCVTVIRQSSKDEEMELKFFMQFIAFYYGHLTENKNINDNMGDIQQNSNLIPFFKLSLNKAIKFISGLAVGINVEIYCALARKWVNATIIECKKENQQIRVQLMDGSGKDQFLSIFSSRLAPIGFPFKYQPNLSKRNNVPNIKAFIDPELKKMAIKISSDTQKNNPGHSGSSSSEQSGFQKPRSNPSAAAPISIPAQDIPRQGWYFQLQTRHIGPLSIAQLFMACVQQKMNESTIIYNQHCGAPKPLKDFPHIIRAFRMHIQKCKKYIENKRQQMKNRARMQSNTVALSTSPAPRFTSQLSIFTRSNSSNSSNYNNTNINHNHNHNNDQDKFQL